MSESLRYEGCRVITHRLIHKCKACHVLSLQASLFALFCVRSKTCFACCTGRFAQGNVNLVLVTHGLALRIILMRWFHWTVDQFLTVYNPPNAEPVILERITPHTSSNASWTHTKMLYKMSEESIGTLRGCSPEMVQPQNL